MSCDLEEFSEEKCRGPRDVPLVLVSFSIDQLSVHSWFPEAKQQRQIVAAKGQSTAYEAATMCAEADAQIVSYSMSFNSDTVAKDFGTQSRRGGGGGKEMHCFRVLGAPRFTRLPLSI